MADEPHHEKRKLPVRRIIVWVGAGLIVLGYGLLSIQPDTESPLAIKRAFLGMGSVIAGAMLWLGAIFFSA